MVNTALLIVILLLQLYQLKLNAYKIKWLHNLSGDIEEPASTPEESSDLSRQKLFIRSDV